MAMSRSHGTGAQVLRIFQEGNLPFFHLYWTSIYWGRSECSGSFCLEDPRYWPWRRGRGFITWLQRLTRLSWWQGNQIDPGKIQALIQAEQLFCDVAYVVVVSEDEAQRAVSLLKHLACPYVVNIMDIVHADGLNPADMPGFRQLLTQAAEVLSLNQAIKAEVEKFGISHMEILPFAQDVTQPTLAAPKPGLPLRIVMVGAVHDRGLQLLTQTWSSLVQHYPKVELVYLGRHFHTLPPFLQKVTQHPGMVSVETYNSILATCHLAYLTGPSELNCFGRFSIPSRLSDFFMVGLPVLACVALGSATKQFLDPLVPHCVRYTNKSSELLQAIEDFTSSEKRWQAASQQACTFALENLSLDVVRTRILERLASACKQGSHLKIDV